MIHRYCKLLGVAAIVFGVSTRVVFAEPITLWPSVPFARGQDICQFVDTYGSSKRQQTGEMISQLERLFANDAESKEALQALTVIQSRVDTEREEARRATDIAITLEATLKASLDHLYERTQPEVRLISFAGAPRLERPADASGAAPSALSSAKTDLLGSVSAFAWGTYSFAPSCAANLLVTLHIQERCGKVTSFQATGRVERVMTDIAGQVFSHYQATRFPVGLSLGPRTVTLVSPAGRSVAKAGTSAQAEAACKALGARLPTAEEYSLLHVRGDWNGGVCTDGKYWALANDYVLAPALVRPSPSRREADVSAEELHFYCIRNP